MPNAPTPEEIRNRAFELYQQRGGAPGSDLEDWVRAEQELRANMGPSTHPTLKGQDADPSDAPESGTRRDAADESGTTGSGSTGGGTGGGKGGGNKAGASKGGARQSSPRSSSNRRAAR
jgi:hypothetical protein